MPSAKPISKTQTGFPEYLDFRHLREEGIRHIQKLSGDVWTDHNLHDPGITILEVLCYALLDLGYRTNLPINELLAQDKSKSPTKEQFFTAAEILSNNPLTVTDYRKLLIDIRGVRNAWLVPSDTSEVQLELDCDAEPQLIYAKIQPNFLKKLSSRNKQVVLNGLWKVLIELEPVNPQAQSSNKCGNDDASLARILDDVNACLHAHRNLCEDFFEICVLQDEQIGVCAHLEIAANADPEDVLVDLFERLRNFLSPALSFYTLETMLEKGKTMEEIFAGRPYRLDSKGMLESHGFIDTEELENLAQKTDIHASDVLQVIMNTPGIDAVSKLMLFNYIGDQAQTSGQEWCLKLTPGYRPILAPELSKITLHKDGIPFSVNMQKVLDRYTVRLSNAQKARLRPYELDKSVPDGKFHAQLGEHYSIQHEFPNVYGIKEGGIPDSASPLRKAQAMQLKGYLLFFDQILANYLAQLAHLRDFFALRPEKRGQLSTFYPGSIESVPDLKQLIRGAVHDAKGEPLTGGATFYQQHELIAIPCASATHTGDDDYLIFDSPQQRDSIIQRSISIFENENAKVAAQLDDKCQKYRFTLGLSMDLPGGGNQLLLRSAALFETEQEALREGESLTFLGLGAEHYRPINRDQLQEYTFELSYNPRDYNSILTALAETPGEARNRRSRFLDHLLARFAEDFSEYALLQFKFGSARAEQETLLIETKENYLADYPDISRNRGKGFDYTDRKQLWDTENVTGLERRVSSLMGIEDWRRRTLSPFAVENKPISHSIELKDFRGRVIFESKEKYVNTQAAFPGFSELVKTLAADPKNYRPIDCGTQGMFSFQLVETMPDGKECVIACHPDTYCCAADRDAKMAYTACLFQGAVKCPPDDGLGHCVKIKASYPGFYFSLETKFSVMKIGAKKNETIHIFIRGAEVFQDKNEALLAWIEFLGQAKNWANFRLTPVPFSQNFLPEVMGQDGQALARLSKFPLSEAKANKALLDVFNYLSKFESPGQLTQSPAAWSWQLGDGQGNTLLESLYCFETREQANKALDHALELAAVLDNLSKKENPDGTLGIELLEQFPATDGEPAYSIALAQSPPAAGWDEAACTVARQQMQKIAEQEAGFYRRGLVKNTALQLTAVDAEGKTWLEGCDIFTDLPAAEIAWNNLLERAALPGNFSITKDAGIEISLLAADGKVLAKAPKLFYNDTDARAFVIAAAQLAKSKALVMDTKNTGKVFNFQLTDANNDALMIGSSWFLDKQEAQAAYYEALYQAKTAANLQAQGDGSSIPFGIVLLDEAMNLRATSIGPFADAATQNIALEEWRTWFGGKGIPAQVFEQQGAWNFSINQNEELVLTGPGTFQTQPAAALAFETALLRGCARDAYRCFKADDACRYSFELLDATLEAVLATHPCWYETEKECSDAVDSLVKFLAENKLPYEIIEEKLPKWHYELCWESCDERIESVLIGQIEYNTVEQAESAFCALLEKIKSAGSIDCRQMDDGSYGFALENGVDTAIHPRSYATQTLCERVICDLMDYVRKVNWMVPPLNATGVGSCFRLLKGAGPVAKYSTSYSTVELRDDALEMLLESIHCGPPEYSVIDLSGCAIADKDGKFYFQLMCGKTVWWRSCAVFDSAQEAMDAFEAQYLAIIALASDPENYQSHCAGDTFCYFWLPDPTDPTCTRCIARTEKFPAGADLKAEFSKRLKWARTYPIFQNPDKTYAFKIADPSTGDLIWLSNHTYATMAEAQYAFEHFLALLCFAENFRKTDDLNACRFGIELEEAGLVSLDPCTKAIPQEKAGCSHSPYYSSILLGKTAIKGEGKEYYFEIQSSQAVWWRGIETHPDVETAANFLQEYYFDIIEASLNAENYSPQQDNGGFYFSLGSLPDRNANVRTAYFLTETDREAAQRAVMGWARRYPVFKTADGQFSFRIFYPGTETVSWESAVTYDAYNRAYRAFLHFLSVYDFKEEYEVGSTGNTPKGSGLQTHYVDVGKLPEAFDEGQTVQSNPDKCWEDLEHCLANLDGGNPGNSLFTRFMPEKDCRWGVFWANDGYRLARAPKVYHTPATRECAREELYHKILCTCLTKGTCKEQWFYPNIKLADCCRILYACEALKKQQGCPCPNTPAGAETRLPWQGDFGLLRYEQSDECCIIKKGQHYIKLQNMIDLMAFARAEECYVKVQHSNPESNLVTIGLLNAQNSLVATGFHYVATADEWESLKQTALEFAWEYPIVRRGDKFGYQVTSGQEILLENITDYDTPMAALEAYCTLIELLKLKTNYVGSAPGDCGPFGIEVVDHTQVKAMHPATYTCRADAEKALENLRYCLKAEGFHVIEHILLRPKTPGIPAEHYMQICVDGQALFTTVSPAADISAEHQAEFLKAFLEMLKELGLAHIEGSLPSWEGEQMISLPINDSKAPGEFDVASAYPLRFDCLHEFLLALNDPAKIDVCIDTHETKGDILFESCADPDDCRNPELTSDCVPGADPYSFWATVAIPWWGSRFRNLDFRHFVEKTLRREAPAHVGLRIGWLGARQMTELETRYRTWLDNNALGDDSCARQEALDALMETMKALRNVYPEASLHDCDSGGAGGAFVLLDQTQLGPD